MRLNRARILTAAAAVVIAGQSLALALVLSSTSVTPTTTAPLSPTSAQLAQPQNPCQGLAGWLLPLNDARTDLNAPELQPSMDDVLLSGDAFYCLYRDDTANAVKVVEVEVYRETTSQFIVGMQQTHQFYVTEKAAHAPYYRYAVAKKCNVSQTPELTGVTAAYYVRSAKYGHTLLFLNYGEHTVRLWIEAGNQTDAAALHRLLRLAPTVTAKMRDFLGT